MTGIRMSFVCSLEDTFGAGKPDGNDWIAPPPGARFRSTASRQVTRVQATGTKKWDTMAYGIFQGTWDMTFMLDYNYLEYFKFAFEDYTPPTEASTATTFTHEFKKVDWNRVPSFTVRRLILNRMAGGPTGSDEIVELVGCVCKSITFARSAGTSQYQVTMSGLYADEHMLKGNIAKTDYQPYEGNLVEYSCLLVGKTGDTSMSDCVYVANTESLSIAIDNSADGVYNVCSSFAQQYYENTTNYTFSAVTYKNNPANWEQKFYSGGQDSTHLAPMSKGLKPMPLAYILSYNGEVNGTNTTQAAAYAASTMGVAFKLTKVVVHSIEYPNGDGSKLVDTISSEQCQQIEMEVKSPVAITGFAKTDDNPHAVTVQTVSA